MPSGEEGAGAVSAIRRRAARLPAAADIKRRSDAELHFYAALAFRAGLCFRKEV